ncbi:MAG: type II toxin-antitoxin system HicB family antitoxin [Phycisphaerales bacterium]|nr:type II toxin-antitoxin system HicB family antitoxin [Phycisphaerales bacterium]
MIQVINLKKMTKADLDKLYEEAEKLTFDNTRPLNAAERRQLARAARKGRPRIGAGAKRINITVEQRLLGKADSYAKKHGLTRAALVAEGLKRILAA